MINHTQLLQTLRYLAICVVTFFALQAVTVVVHEFSHSTMAWVLGDMRSPLSIVWGNPLTMTGWDEGVDYNSLFSQGRDLQAAVIGFCPLVMHTIVVTLGLFLMQGQWLFQKKWHFHFVYWLVVANVMELVAYVFMRSFSGHGDIGIFDRGTGLSPWWVFGVGSTLLTCGLLFLFRTVMPRLEILFAKDNSLSRWAIVALTSFAIFLWGSGIRVVAYVTGSQWLFGLIGIPACLLTVLIFRPGRLDASRLHNRG